MNNTKYFRHVRRFQVMVAAIILTVVCVAVGQLFSSTAQAETFSAPAFTTEVVTTLPHSCRSGSRGLGTDGCSSGSAADGLSHMVTLGNQQGNNAFSGTLDEVRIYSRVLTLVEIQADQATPIAP